ncbi:MAG TPA: EAL domain-containing protein [Cellvibrionaceae bacterium]|nr:EAL domain-containing protein [Cellvibrionaceae bacterium]
MRLLLIDDDELDRLAVIRALKKSTTPHEICECANAADGLRMSACENFDVILLDYRLPDMDGLAVLRQLRSGNFAEVAVVMLSSIEDDAVAEQCFEAGAQDFMLKDEVNGRRLIRAVRQAKQRYEIERALQNSHDQLRILAERDPLTGLSNRRGFDLALKAAIAHAKRTHESIALVLIDLDDFKTVNDTLGHEAGDKLLVELSVRLREMVRDSDFICRLGGDEFLILATSVQKEEQIALLVERLNDALHNPIKINGTDILITASIGVALLGQRADNADELFKCADIAMYRAKQNGRNQSHFYNEQLDALVKHKAKIKLDLYKALTDNEFKLYYQIKVNAQDGSLGGAEALVRWQHPELGLLMPNDFISIAEDCGLIVKLGVWILREACRQFHDWRQRLPAARQLPNISINLSAIQIRNHHFLAEVKQALADYQLQSEHLELEITENALIRDSGLASELLNALSQMGLSIALDDFGTGYSSIQHLKAFPIDVLKIDKEFVSAIGRDAAHEKLLTAIIKFAKALDLIVVAEGIETQAQAQFCHAAGCDLLQGYYYSRPIPAEGFEAQFLRADN